MSGPVVMATLAMGGRQTLRIARVCLNGASEVDLRICTELTKTSGLMIPTSKGFSIPVAMVPQLIARLAAAAFSTNGGQA